MRVFKSGAIVLAAMVILASQLPAKVIFKPVSAAGCTLPSGADIPITFSLGTDGDTEQLNGLVEQGSFLRNNGIIQYTATANPSTQISLSANPAMLSNGHNKAYVAFFTGSSVSATGYVVIDLSCFPTPTISLTTDVVNVQTPAGQATVNVALPSEINGASGLSYGTSPISFTLTPDTQSSPVSWISSATVPGSTAPSGSGTVADGGTADLNVTINPAGLAAQATPYVGFLHIRDSSNTVGAADLTILLTVTGAVTGNAVLPHIAVNGPYVNGFSIVNTGIYTGSYRLNFLDDSGKPLQIAVQGQGFVDHISGNLTARSSFYIEAGDASLQTVGGSAQIIADPGIGVEGLFRHRVQDSTGTHYWEAGVLATIGSFEFQIPFDDTVFGPTNEQGFTGIAIANLDSVNAANVTCTARDAAANVIPNALPALTIQPNGHWAGFNFTPLNGQRGTIDCTANTIIGAIALHTFPSGANSTLSVFLK